MYGEKFLAASCRPRHQNSCKHNTFPMLVTVGYIGHRYTMYLIDVYLNGLVQAFGNKPLGPMSADRSVSADRTI